MPSVVFVAPFLMSTTRGFVEAAADLPEVRLGLVTKQPLEAVPEGLRQKLAAHWRIEDPLHPGQIQEAVQQLSRQGLGPIHRLLGSLEQLQVPLGQVRDALGIAGMGAEAARNFRDKARMKTVLRQAGIPCARHRLAANRTEAREFAAHSGFPLVIKPPDGAGAKGTFRIEDGPGLEQALEMFRPAPGREVLLEEFVVGDEFSFEAMSLRGEVVWRSFTHYQPTPLQVLENPWIQWCILLPREIDHPRYSDITRAGAAALKALGMGTGLSHMEWFRRRDGSIAISEVGARPPGAQITTLLSYAHGVNFKRVWTELMVFDRLRIPERSHAAGAAFLRGQGRGRVRNIRGLAQAQEEIGHLVVESNLPKLGQAPADGYEGEGFVILRHPETAVVEQALHRLVSLVRVEMGP
jgi:hypothetical protein